MKGLKTICGLLLAACIFSSCEKETTLTNYLFYFNEQDGFTQPQEISDPDVRAFYVSLREGFAELSVNTLWQVDVTNRQFGPDDEKALARSNSNLAAIKEKEAQYRKQIAELGAHEGSSFHVTYVYKLSRDIPADHFTSDHSTTILQEYTFELRYN